MGKVVLLGLDGATFTLLDPLIQENRLPNLARLVKTGVRGPLRSTIHPLTPAAWTSAVTGQNPGKHGIFDFRRRRAASYTLELVNARQRDAEPLWTTLSDLGRRVGVFNVPMTFPPDAVNGFMVSGMDTPGVDSSLVYPTALRSSLLAAAPGYQIDLDEATGDEDVFLGRVQALASVQQQALDALITQHPDLDFLMAVFVATDRLYHAFWHYLDETHPAYLTAQAERVRAVHGQILHEMDSALGRLWAWAGDDATIMVISDHGFGALEKDVFMNRFLLDAGYLHVRPEAKDAPFAEMVDWQRTRAYAFGYFGNINLNLRGREPLGCVEQGRAAEEVKSALIESLRDLRDPDTGEIIASAVYRREELYSGPRVADAPDLLIVMRDYAYMTRDGYEGVHGRLVAPPMSLSRQRLVHTGNHRLDGVFMMAGPGVRAGFQISGATLLDIAPTVLYAMNVPVPGIMDGHVLRQAYTDDALKQQPPRRLLSPPPPPQSAGQRQMAALAQRAGELEARLTQIEAERSAAALYAQQIEAAVQDKNTHIAQLGAALHERDGRLAHYERTIFFRAYQRARQLAQFLRRRGSR